MLELADIYGEFLLAFAEQAFPLGDLLREPLELVGLQLELSAESYLSEAQFVLDLSHARLAFGELVGTRGRQALASVELLPQ